jgi:hypothetical protein
MKDEVKPQTVPSSQQQNSPSPQKRKYPQLKKVQLLPAEQNIAAADSAPVKTHGENIPEQPLAEQAPQKIIQPAAPLNVVIHENNFRAPEENKNLVVLDDKDLAELGLKEKSEVPAKSVLANAVNGAGKLFGVKAHYGKEQDYAQSKFTETVALGPLAITRTVSR